MCDKSEKIKCLEAELADTKEKRDWYWNQYKGLDRQISDAYGGNRGAPYDEDYWGTKDLIEQRRDEAFDCDRRIENLEAELRALRGEE